MTGALAPFSYLVYIYLHKWKKAKLINFDFNETVYRFLDVMK